MTRVLFWIFLTIFTEASSASNKEADFLPKVRKYEATRDGKLVVPTLMDEYDPSPKIIFEGLQTTQIIEEYSSAIKYDEPIELRRSSGAFMEVPKDVIQYLVNWLKQQRQFRHTCRRMLLMKESSELNLTLPHNFTRSDEWRAILHGNNPFPWAGRVTRIGLFALNEFAKAIDADGVILNREKYAPYFFMKLKETFPNIRDIVLSGAESRGDHAKSDLQEVFGLKTSIEQFKWENALSTYFCSTHLTERSATLLGELYVEEKRSGFFTERTLGARFWKDPRNCYWYKPENELLYIPWDKERLGAILYLYERFAVHPKFPINFSFGEEWKLKVTDSLRMFISALAGEPDLWDMMLYIHREMCPIDKFLLEFAGEDIVADRDRLCGGLIVGRVETTSPHQIKELVSRLKRLYGPETMKIISLMKVHMDGLMAMKLGYDKIREKILQAMLGAYGEVMQRGDYRYQALRMFTRLFAIYPPLMWTLVEPKGFMDNTKIKIDEQKCQETPAADLWQIIQNINLHFYHFSDDEFDRFVTYIRTKQRVRRHHLAEKNPFWIPDYLYRYEVEGKKK